MNTQTETLSTEVQNRVLSTLDYLGEIAKTGVESELPALAKEIVTYGTIYHGFWTGTTLVCMAICAVVFLLVLAAFFYNRTKDETEQQEADRKSMCAIMGFACGAMTIIFLCLTVNNGMKYAKAAYTPRVFLFEWVSKQVR